MVIIKTPDEIEAMSRAGELHTALVKQALALCKPGALPIDIDRTLGRTILARGAVSASLGHRLDSLGGIQVLYPANTCISVNNVIMHGVPSSVPLAKGDKVTFDICVKLDGWAVDGAVSVIVGRFEKDDSESLHIRKAILVAEQALIAGISQAQVGKRIGDISSAIETVCTKAGLTIPLNSYGHGIGRSLHEDPNVFNFGQAETGMDLVPGMVLAIEPIVVDNGPDQLFHVAGDPISLATSPEGIGAHSEMTVAITHDGPRILTDWRGVVNSYRQKQRFE